MNITLHFPKGSTSIIDGTYTGYEYSRSDKLINAQITFDESYKLFINQHRLVLSYKYITVRCTSTATQSVDGFMAGTQ